MYKSCKYLVVAAALALASTLAYSQDSFQEGEFRPYDEVSVPPSALSGSVETRVLYFAHFTCPYCRQAHGYLRDWGGQLPPPYEFELIPAIGLQEHIPMAIAYYVVLQLAPERLSVFESALYQELQDRGRHELQPQTFREAAARVGINHDDFDRATGSLATEKFVERAFALTAMYGVTEVPTIVVANQFKTGPGRVYNDQKSFVSLLNGLISMDYQQRIQK